MAFAQMDLGLAQAKAIIFMLAVAAITLTQLYFNKKREVEM
jgi:raffinose/stachyose/melibiose transport system permease protein